MGKIDYKRQRELAKEYTKQYGLKLNIHTDADIIAKIETIDGSFQGYIKSLIRKDIENNK